MFFSTNVCLAPLSLPLTVLGGVLTLVAFDYLFFKTVLEVKIIASE